MPLKLVDQFPYLDNNISKEKRLKVLEAVVIKDNPLKIIYSSYWELDHLNTSDIGFSVSVTWY